MIIRNAETKDAPSISRLLQQLTQDFITKDCTQEGAEILLNSMQVRVIESQLLEGDEYYLAEVEQKIVGVIGIKPKKHLFHLFVDQSFHKQGIAKALWEQIIQQKQHQSCTFSVNSSINAKGFYKKLGFKVQSGVEVKNGIPSIPMRITID